VRALGRELRRARREASLTQEDMARKAKMDRSYISDVERGQHTPSVAIFIKLCKAIGIAPSKVMRRMEGR
jgi:transcriptional regulator with XRE-family HTH domain